MNLASKLVIIENPSGSKRTRQLRIKLDRDRDLWELRDLLREAIGANPSVLTIDPDGLGVAEYYRSLPIIEASVV